VPTNEQLSASRDARSANARPELNAES
jgi:hypothetical protein